MKFHYLALSGWMLVTQTSTMSEWTDGRSIVRCSAGAQPPNGAGCTQLRMPGLAAPKTGQAAPKAGAK